ncbi:MAG: pyruvate dehydrogenase (acetyl-transferring), homodimeric type [Gammaproteobacteria bacterium]|nr:pyruvate dehydrogenase (acetyl-transferring), homodimeric type [Gammaproteobacteria bacterium]
MTSNSKTNPNAPSDIDPTATDEWLASLRAVLQHEGKERAHFILSELTRYARQAGVNLPYTATTDYINTINPVDEPAYPGDMQIEARIDAFMRWNAMAMVVAAGYISGELGGHIASFASSALLYEVGLHHFFHAANGEQGGDLVYFQGHSSPGIYAHAFLDGRLTEKQLKNFRQEVEKDGLSSYPHPWLMPDFWQFPTVSMGLGPIQGIYQARFLKYLQHRGLLNTEGRKVWVFCGDGEMDEPESLGALNIAMKEGLDNLIFVINCNLQRLDGPVRGNGKIVQDLEGIFRGAGWNTFKVLWDRHWDNLFETDDKHELKNRLMELVDGEYQNIKAKDGKYMREQTFAHSEELLKKVAHLSDDELFKFNFGGHDSRKIYAAYNAATHQENGKPTVILVKTIKGYGMGAVGQAKNTTHQQKKLSEDDIRGYRDRFMIPVDDEHLKKVPFVKFAENSAELNYLKQHRAALGGSFPQRRERSDEQLQIPALSDFEAFLGSTDGREISTTMAFVRILNHLMKDQHIKDRIIPIIPDECRTFGMEGMFRQFGIYSHVGQLYKPVDADQLMYYREDKKGQVLEEGITEAGGFCSWLAAATSYSNNNFAMIPFFIYYSMFGHQRVGDLAWAAGDIRARGFLLGGTAGRTTLAGEGLQHQDGQSQVMAGFVPNCKSYDPTFMYELTVIIQDGLRRMYVDQEDVYYYLTVMNENYAHPAMPKGAEEGIIKGMYLLQSSAKKAKQHVQLLGCGTILREVMAAAEILEKEYKITSDIWSVTSFNEVTREAIDTVRWNRFHPEDKQKTPYVSACLEKQEGPIIAATDYIRAFADQIREFLPNKTYTVLGTDGFGRSDDREQLRHFFEVDSKHIVHAVLKTLADEGSLPQKTVAEAMKKLGIKNDKPNPITV